MILALTISLTACSVNQNKHDNEQEHSEADKQLQQLIDDEQEYQDSLNPFKKDSEKLYYDVSPQALKSQYQENIALRDRLAAIDSDALSLDNRINQTILLYKLNNDIDNYRFKEHYIPLTAEAGFHAYLPYMVDRSAFKTVEDYQLYLQRLNYMPTYFDQQMYWMKLGLETGRTQPQVVLKGFEDSISAFIVDDAAHSPFYRPFKQFPDHFDKSTRERLQADAEKTITEVMNPTYQEFYDFMVGEYIPNARKNIAATSLPDGDAFYQNRIEYYTTLNLTAEQIHQIGLEEVARIRAEMEAIIESVKFDGDFAQFVDFLRTDPQFYATSAEELLKEASYIAKKMDAQLPALFKTLPRTPYGVVPVPASIAPKYTTGRYSGPSRDDQPGEYWVNTYALDRRPLYVLEALTLHEAVPGHHLQGSIAREMENVPSFRQQTYISAFGEGWGLYSEYLGIEAGFYQDPYSDFGRLTYEMWRAARLVVDTGMHSMGWSRDKAMDFLASNTALSLHNVRTEIDRYISWPAQALSYKLGEIKIKELRTKAENELGADFDIREFHDEVLKNGSVPLSLLEELIDEYIVSKKIN
ncbi:DUF885 domain-containing protein [Thalassotalea sp. PS06]|uniref:DUF885 domain-containing protein n=1 Tax=Thalassotalea sp. PS06 TaxID=2594005 RepID=UPI0011656518|nr:DUF885 domain-containing protein [Thalassotalea sp. PS06]QDP03062.1 DUF885 domain-containing protein [Thalassotalea sp. PS06]